MILTIVLSVIFCFIIFVYLVWRSAMAEFHLYDKLAENPDSIYLTRHIRDAGNIK
jgi:hypothetical protein